MPGGTLVDLLSEAEARMACGIGVDDNKKLALLQQMNTAVSVKLAECVGPVIYATISAETHNGGKPYIYLKNPGPIQGITQLVEYDNTTASTLTAESNTSKAAANYLLEPVAGKVTRRDSNTDVVFPWGRQNVVVTYVVGRYTQTSTVGDRYKAAASLILKNAWRAYETAAVTMGEFDVPHASFPSFITANAAKDMLADEWRTGSGIGE